MKKLLLILTVFVWTILIGLGFCRMMDYTSSPGLPANVAKKLPENIFPESADKLPKLLLFLHPQCPCSRATLNELSRIVSGNPNLVDIKIIFYLPDGESTDWVEGDL